MRTALLKVSLGLAMLLPVTAGAEPGSGRQSGVLLAQERREEREERREERCERIHREIEHEERAERGERREGDRREAREIHERVEALRDDYREHCERR
jgi:hypothetical protein